MAQRKGIANSAGIITPTTTLATRTFELQKCVAADADFCRFDYGGSQHDGVVQEVLNAGLQMILNIGGTVHYPGPSMSSLISQCQYAANKWGAVIKYFEIWNEPDQNGWTPQTYAPYLIQAHTTLHSIMDPKGQPCIVGHGGLFTWGADKGGNPPGMQNWVSQMYAAGMKGHCDLMNLHFYNDPTTRGSWNTWDQAFLLSPCVRSVMDANGDQAILIANSEGGQPGLGDAAQVTLIQRALDDFQNRPRTGYWNYYLMLHEYDPGYNDALVDANRNVRPGFFTFRDHPINGAGTVTQTQTQNSAWVGPVTAAGQTMSQSSDWVGPVVGTDTTPPNCTLTAPSAGGVSGSVALAATASDAGSGVAGVVFLVDGVVVASDTSSPYTGTWNAALASNGPHIVSARATDNAGNVSNLSSVTVIVTGGLAAGAAHKRELFPALTLETDLVHDTLAIPYPAQVLNSVASDGRLATGYYRLQEASGTVGAEAQGKTAGTYSGTVTYHVASPVQSDDYAVTLDTNGVFVCGQRYSATVSDLTPYGITMCGWFKANAIGTTTRLLSTTNANAVVLLLGSDGKLWIARSDNFNNPAVGQTVISAGEWFFAALTITGTTPPDDPNQDPSGFASAFLMKLSDLKDIDQVVEERRHASALRACRSTSPPTGPGCSHRTSSATSPAAPTPPRSCIRTTPGRPCTTRRPRRRWRSCRRSA